MVGAERVSVLNHLNDDFIKYIPKQLFYKHESNAAVK